MGNESQCVASVGCQLDTVPITGRQAREPRNLVEAHIIERIFDAVGRGGFIKNWTSHGELFVEGLAVDVEWPSDLSYG